MSRSTTIGRCCNSLQKKVHAKLLFTAIELTIAAFFELSGGAINYAISDTCVVTLTFFLSFTHFFGEGIETPYVDSGKMIDLRSFSPDFIINSNAVLFDSCERV